MQLRAYLHKETSAAPLALFRICFGLMMLYSMIRFWVLGWIEKLYIEPHFHFSYYGFSWVKPIGNYTYLIFLLCGLSAIFVAIGWRYRLSILIFFLSFTYIELMDKTTYLNHYYFISSLGLLLCFLPAGRYFSLDSYRLQNGDGTVPQWSIDSLKLLIGIVYFYAGLAKLHADWLVDAMPLKIWLPGRHDIPLIGPLLEQEWVAYAFSWGGAVYDLFIPFALLYKPTRYIAFAAVIIFHVLTRVLFPIGIFPLIMIVSALIFFDAGFHTRMLMYLSRLLRLGPNIFTGSRKPKASASKFTYLLLVIFFAWQLLVPFRHLAYPDKLFWTEEGYRFSWRVMLMEKAGNATFRIVDGKSKKRFYVNNSDFLTSFQEKQMSTQPDFIVEYAHYLRDHFASQGHQNIEVYVDSYVALNGARSRPFIDPTVDLAKVSNSFSHKKWILPFED